MMKHDKHMGVSGRSRYLQKLADKMKSGMSHSAAANEILNEESPGPPFDLETRHKINDVLYRTKDAAKIVGQHEAPTEWEVKSLDVWGIEDTGGGLIEIKDAKTGEPLYLLYGPS